MPEVIYTFPVYFDGCDLILETEAEFEVYPMRGGWEALIRPVQVIGAEGVVTLTRSDLVRLYGEKTVMAVEDKAAEDWLDRGGPGQVKQAAAEHRHDYREVA